MLFFLSRLAPTGSASDFDLTMRHAIWSDATVRGRCITIRSQNFVLVRAMPIASIERFSSGALVLFALKPRLIETAEVARRGPEAHAFSSALRSLGSSCCACRAAEAQKTINPNRKCFMAILSLGR